MKYVDVSGREIDPEEPEAWKASVDETATSKGWVCVTCAALLAPKPSMAIKHLAWHQEIERS